MEATYLQGGHRGGNLTAGTWRQHSAVRVKGREQTLRRDPLLRLRGEEGRTFLHKIRRLFHRQAKSTPDLVCKPMCWGQSYSKRLNNKKSKPPSGARGVGSVAMISNSMSGKQMSSSFFQSRSS